MQSRVISDNKKIALTIERLCHQLIENHRDFSNSAIIGIQPKGIYFSDRIVKRLLEINPALEIPYGKLDITFYRDDFRRTGKPLSPSATDIDFSIEQKRIILIDDVLYTGRTVRAALDAVVDFGRPEKIELMVLIDRRFSRELPIQPDYTGQTVDAIESEKVKVLWNEKDGRDAVLIVSRDVEIN